MDGLPFPGSLPKMDLTPTKVRIIRPCLVHGRRREPGELLELPRWDAVTASVTGRMEIVADAAGR